MKNLLLFTFLTITISGLVSCSTEKNEVSECCRAVIEVEWEWANANLDGRYWEITTIDCDNDVRVEDLGFAYGAPYEVGDEICN